MPKTPLRTLLLRRLTALNDQLCFFQLIDYEFEERLGTFGSGVANAYTPDVFARNPFAERINVTVAELPRFRHEHRGLTLGAHFVSSYEVAAQFFTMAQALLLEVNGTLSAPKRLREGPEQYYSRLLKASGLSAAPKMLLESLTYCRHRRNAFVHLSASVPQSFVLLTTQQGSALNARWQNERGAVDFCLPTIAPLDDKEALTLLQLLRICVQDLDEHLSSILDTGGIAKYVSQRLKKRVEAPGPRALGKRVAAIRRAAVHNFGIDPGEANAAAAV